MIIEYWLFWVLAQYKNSTLFLQKKLTSQKLTTKREVLVSVSRTACGKLPCISGYALGFLHKSFGP